MGTALIGSLIAGGASYLGAKAQADAVKEAGQQQFDLEQQALNEYKSTVGPGVDAAKQAFASGVPDAYTDPQFKAAGYASDLGEYLSAEAIPEYQRGKDLEDLAIQQNLQRLGITPEGLAQKQLGIANLFGTDYNQNVTSNAVGAVQSDYDNRAKQLAASLAGRGQLGSTIAGQGQAALEGARAKAIGDLTAEQAALARQDALSRANETIGQGFDLRTAAGTNIGNIGSVIGTRGIGQADRAIQAGETAARLGIDAAFAPARNYLGVVQSPTTATPRLTAPPAVTTSPLAFGIGQGLQTYSDLTAQNKK